jgi:DNA-binding transcriptional ArsR family regulator
MEENQIPDTLIIHDLETLKVIADTLRTQILEALVHESLNVRQVAERLGLSPSKLYYHVNLLEKHGLIRVVDIRVVANIIENIYRATASNIEIDPELLSFKAEGGKENIHTLISNIIDSTREDFLRSLEARTFDLERGAPERARRAIMNRELSRMTDEKSEEFARRIEALIKEFSAADLEEESPDEALQTYALTIAFYPSFYFPDEKKKSDRED